MTKELSTEEETAALGGLRPGVQQGQNEPALDEAIFSATEGEVVGPIETEAGFYVFQVEKVNEAVTQPLDETTSAQIRQQLVTQEQQQAVTEFQDSFVAKWRARTVCSEDLLADDEDGTVQTQLAERCSNFAVTDDGCLGDDEERRASARSRHRRDSRGAHGLRRVRAPPARDPSDPAPAGRAGSVAGDARRDADAAAAGPAAAARR